MSLNTLYLDLVAQRAASVARIADLTKKAASADPQARLLYGSMAKRYIDAMPSLDRQIAEAAQR